MKPVEDEPISLPNGTRVQIQPVESKPNSTLAEQFARIIGKGPELPTDMARNHDHYLYGSPKE